MNAARPLQNRKTVVACSEDKSEALARGLADMGAEVTILPVLAIRPIEDSAAIRNAVLTIHSYDWILFTSGYGVRCFSQHLTDGVHHTETLPPVCAIGPATAEIARYFGFRVALIPEDYLAEGVLRAFRLHLGSERKLAGLRILLPRAKEGRDVLPRELTSAGAIVDLVPCYETVPGEISGEMQRSLLEHPPDLMVFTSASAIRNYVLLVGPQMPAAGTVAALGPVTAEAAVSLLGKCDIIPQAATIESLLQAVQRHYESMNRQDRTNREKEI
jgi:uroporphyrinogen III methyltransferase / synthase